MTPSQNTPSTPASSPAWLPLDIDLAANSAALVEMSEADYRDASFLDGRLVAAGKRALTALRPELQSIAEGLPIRCHMIFHVGHVGSTLISRLVGEHPDLFVLREPAALRTLALTEGTTDVAGVEQWLDMLLALYSRTWRTQQTAVIKATSFVSQLGPHMLARVPDARALLVTTSPLAYLSTIFGGEASREESRALAPARLQRLHRRIGAQPWAAAAMSEGETIAMGWLSEMAALSQIAAEAPGRTGLVNFDRLLADPQSGLAGILKHLGAEVDVTRVRTILAGPLLTRYSKGPEHAYDTALRRAVAHEAQARHGREIDGGMRWLGEAAARLPAMRNVLEWAAAASR